MGQRTGHESLRRVDATCCNKKEKHSKNNSNNNRSNNNKKYIHGNNTNLMVNLPTPVNRLPTLNKPLSSL